MNPSRLALGPKQTKMTSGSHALLKDVVPIQQTEQQPGSQSSPFPLPPTPHPTSHQVLPVLPPSRSGLCGSLTQSVAWTVSRASLLPTHPIFPPLGGALGTPTCYLHFPPPNLSAPPHPCPSLQEKASRLVSLGFTPHSPGPPPPFPAPSCLQAVAQALPVPVMSFQLPPPTAPYSTPAHLCTCKITMIRPRVAPISELLHT